LNKTVQWIVDKQSMRILFCGVRVAQSLVFRVVFCPPVIISFAVLPL
jgi:hypothetical protein